MKVYIDAECHCHATNPDGVFREVETDFFDNKCTEFVEGHIFIPAGESCISPEGVLQHGKLIAPWKNCNELEVAQREYERSQITEYEAAMSEIETALGVTE